MKGRLALLVLAGVQGGYMLFDGIHVLRTGRYFGGQPGPWSALPRALGIDVFHLGPLFVLAGILWLIAGALVMAGSRRAAPLYVTVAAASLLYPVFGTLLAGVSLVLVWQQLRTGSG